ncbi:MAG: GNAT family N-acetyltransferase [Actinomycetota bacterium]|nr:GNAT family N-acetyltransferase [Actinomycetota bacterium]
MFLFHVATESDWSRAQDEGAYTRSTYGRSLAEIGFVHCSAGHDQVDEMLPVVYAEVTDPLRLLAIDPDRLGSPWKLAEVPGAARPYPHVYGPLNLDAVVDTAAMTRCVDGWTYPWLTPSIRDAGQVVVRPAADPDWPVLHRWIVDPALRTYLGGPGDSARAEAQRGAMYGPGGFALEVGGQCIGFITVTPRGADQEVSYVVLPEHQGYGYARAALPGVTDWVFATRPTLHRLVAVTQAANAPSRRLLESTGWTELDRCVEFGEPQVRYALRRP